MCVCVSVRVWLFVSFLLSPKACGCSHVGVGESVQLSADVKSNILKALELNPKDSASLHILGIWHFSVANLGFLSRSFVKVNKRAGSSLLV